MSIEQGEGGVIIWNPTPQETQAKAGEKWVNLNVTVCKLMLEQIAFGKSLFEIEKEPGMAPANSFIQWVLLYPDVARMYSIARELSGFMLEEEALYVARQLRETPKDNLNVKATEVLINQLKWAAGKRNPSVFSDKAALNITVPIQINTTLDLGDNATGATKDFPNIYDMSAQLEQAVPLEEVPIDVLERELAEAQGKAPPGAARKPRAKGGKGKAQGKNQAGGEGKAPAGENPGGAGSPA